MSTSNFSPLLPHLFWREKTPKHMAQEDNLYSFIAMNWLLHLWSQSTQMTSQATASVCFIFLTLTVHNKDSLIPDQMYESIFSTLIQRNHYKSPPLPHLICSSPCSNQNYRHLSPSLWYFPPLCCGFQLCSLTSHSKEAQ